MGEFWAGKASTRKKTILRVGETDYRCNTIQGLSAKEAESVLALFIEGKFVAGSNVDAQSLDHVDWSKPSMFVKRGEVLSAGFPHKTVGEGFFDMELKLKGKQLTIVRMYRAVP